MTETDLLGHVSFSAINKRSFSCNGTDSPAVPRALGSFLALFDKQITLSRLLVKSAESEKNISSATGILLFSLREYKEN